MLYVSFFSAETIHINISQLHDYYIEPAARGAPEPHTKQRSKNKHLQAAVTLLGLDYEQRASPSSRFQSLEAEVDTYLAVPSGDLDCIAFWEVCCIFNLIITHLCDFQENRNEFPTLFKMAMDILPIQASSVPCERVFSSSKETITARRNSLSPRTVEALQILKYSAKKGRGLDFGDDLGRDEELAELEKTEEGQCVEDLMAFLHGFED